jgi:hypothetical protein
MQLLVQRIAISDNASLFDVDHIIKKNIPSGQEELPATRSFLLTDSDVLVMCQVRPAYITST